jgi:hypothetical protein
MPDNEDDFDVDDVLNNYNKKKKKKNSGRKGKQGERDLISELEIRFPGQPFSRSLGSGNRWAQASLTETAKKVFTGDIITPENFLFAIECKKGYNQINLERAVKRQSEGKRGNALLDEFLDQAEKDGERISKMPMMCWKKDYQPWKAFLKTDNIPKELKPETRYGDWSIFSLEEILKLPDTFFVKSE